MSHLQRGANDVLNVPDVDFPRYIELSTGATFHNIASRIALLGVDRKDRIGVGVHDSLQKLKKKIPTVDETGHVNAGKEAGEVLVKDEWRCREVKFCGLKCTNKIEDVPFGQVVRASFWEELVNQLGNAVSTSDGRLAFMKLTIGRPEL